ncbi:hypothetical protein QUF73_07640 [Cytobacillus sp. NJ13]|nr:hypothetical protein [Cytobacillus sp. NJ13]
MGQRNTKLSEFEIKILLSKYGLELETSFSNYKNIYSEIEVKCKNNHINNIRMYQITDKRRKGEYKCPDCQKDELLRIMRNYYLSVGFPTQRAFKAINGLPNYGTYNNLFGSFKNAILTAGIPIPEEREGYFDRKSLTDNEMLILLKHFTNEKLKTSITLLTYDEIDEISNMPHSSCYANRFGSLENAYKKIAINSGEFNRRMIKKDMKEKYLQVKDLIGRTPNSRDLDEYSKKGICYAMKTYETHFGSLFNLQTELGFKPTGNGLMRNITDEELINNLRILGNELGRIPTVIDVENRYSYGYENYAKRFGTFDDALIKAGYKNIRRRVFITKGGIKCFSLIEYEFTNMLEEYGYNFKKDVLYSMFIPDFKRKLKLDYILLINDETHYVEIFGIEGSDAYEKIKKLKRETFNEEKLKLIEFSHSEISRKTTSELKNLLMTKIQ